MKMSSGQKLLPSLVSGSLSWSHLRSWSWNMLNKESRCLLPEGSQVHKTWASLSDGLPINQYWSLSYLLHSYIVKVSIIFMSIALYTPFFLTRSGSFSRKWFFLSGKRVLGKLFMLPYGVFRVSMINQRFICMPHNSF